MDINQFRVNLPAFSDVEKYPDAVISYWSGLAEKLVSPERWGNIYTQAIELWTAHNIILESQSIEAAENGGVPGSVSGITSSKSVGSASISYDTASAMEKDAGHWNQTTYGRKFFRLMRMFGAGAVQL